jgi:hypothetical protein
MNCRVAVLVVSLFCIALSCSVFKDVQQAMANLARCTFKVESVSNFALAGVPLGGKASLGMSDGARILAAFSRNEVPASFTLNIAAVNPNDGTGGTRKSSATLTSFAWTLLIDNTTTVTGNIASPITIPATGEHTIIPLQMNLDLATFFRDRGYDGIVNLALALGGARGSPARITLRATPTISTQWGPITYPGEIEIIDREFR